MLNITEATKVIAKNLPGWKIQRATPFKGDLFIFLVEEPQNSPEQGMDPYYSVNRKTGEFKEFSIVDGTTPLEVFNAFETTGVDMKKKK